MFLLISLVIEQRLIYTLLKYLHCMRQFGELLYIHKNEKKDRTLLENWRKIILNDPRQRTDREIAIDNAKYCRHVIKLWHGHNVNIWAENWLMMHAEANCYFNRFQYILYSIIVAVITGVTNVIYNLLTSDKEQMFEQYAILGLGLIVILLLWAQLLVISLKLAGLEIKHMELLLNQKVWIEQMILDLTLRDMNGNDHNRNIKYMEKCVDLIDDVMCKIKRNGLSPKLAGIAFDKAFVRITWSLVISVVTAGISYYIRRTK
eukprot:177706_1